MGWCSVRTVLWLLRPWSKHSLSSSGFLDLQHIPLAALWHQRGCGSSVDTTPLGHAKLSTLDWKSFTLNMPEDFQSSTIILGVPTSKLCMGSTMHMRGELKYRSSSKQLYLIPDLLSTSIRSFFVTILRYFIASLQWSFVPFFHSVTLQNYGKVFAWKIATMGQSWCVQHINSFLQPLVSVLEVWVLSLLTKFFSWERKQIFRTHCCSVP